MKLAVSMWSMHRKAFNDGWTVMDFLRHCVSENIRDVELLDVFWRDQQSELKEVTAFCKQHGLTVAAYAVSNDLAQSDEAARVRELDKIVQGFPIARALGTNVIRVFSGDLKVGMEFDVVFSDIVASYRSVVKIAQEYGVVMALENHGRLAGRSNQVRAMIDAVGSPWLRATIDVGNFVLVDQDPIEATRELTSYAAHVHFKDMRRSDKPNSWKSLAGVPIESTAVGDGEVDLKKAVDVLRQGGYDGYISLEFEAEGDEIEGLRASMAHASKVLA